MKVSAYRDLIDHAFRCNGVDYHSCVGDVEKGRWLEIARRVLAELRGATCKTAKADDIRRALMAGSALEARINLLAATLTIKPEA